MIIADAEVYSSYVTVRKRDMQRTDTGGYTHNARPRFMNRQEIRDLHSTDTEELKNILLPMGACGLKVQFQFMDPAWNRLSKTAVFRSGNVTVDAAIAENCAVIPHEVLARVMNTVSVGVYGTDSGKVMAIPTVWAQLGTVSSAANPSGVSSAEPTLPYWAQIKEQVDVLRNEMMDQEDLKNALIQAKESGEFDGPQGIQGEKGDTGKSVYDLAVDGGYEGTEVEFAEAVKTLPEATASAQEAAENAKAYIATASDALSSIREVVDGQDAPSIVCDASGEVIAVNDASDRLLRGLSIYGKTTQNGTPTPDTPVDLESVGDGGSVTVTALGKNLLPNTVTNQTVNGVEITVNKDGSITLDGTSTQYVNIRLYTEVLPAGTYIATADRSANYVGWSQIRTFDNSKICDVYDNRDNMFTADGISRYCLLYIIEPNLAVSNETFYPMIRLASITDRTYEPYKEAQTLSASTPNGLPGIPVSSGGNYTDENGQQWICDEIDFARGKYVQRVKHERVTRNSYWMQSASMSSRFKLINAIKANIMPLCNYYICTEYLVETVGTMYNNNGAEICFNTPFTSIDDWLAWLDANEVYLLYAPVTPIETDLIAEELVQYSALHTNKLNTTIYNDAGAGMTAEYVADTKLYIDNKFAELASAILNNV